jgi:hypothetical protein
VTTPTASTRSSAACSRSPSAPYARAARESLEPRESLLRDELRARAEQEAEPGAGEVASKLRTLSERLASSCGEGSIDVNWDLSQFDRDNSARQRAGGYALIANRVAADILRDRDRPKAARDLEAADRSLRRAQDALEDHDYNGVLSQAVAAYRSVRAGAAKAGVKVRVREPSTWTVLAAPKGSRMKPSTIDLGPVPRAKRSLP